MIHNIDGYIPQDTRRWWSNWLKDLQVCKCLCRNIQSLNKWEYDVTFRIIKEFTVFKKSHVDQRINKKMNGWKGPFDLMLEIFQMLY